MPKNAKRIKPSAMLGLTMIAMLFLFGCQGLQTKSSNGNTPAPSAGSPPAGLNSINHVILFMQENRSFDHYFGQLNVYRASKGLPQDVDTWGPNKTPDGVATAGYDPATGQPGPLISAFHMQSACSENLSSAWNESHREFNLHDRSLPNGGPDVMDGFAFVEGHFASDSTLFGFGQFQDVTGKRAMGYFNQNDLPFYYFMASNFATSDRWFSPVMSRTQPNRMYMLAGTSAGHVYPLAPNEAQLAVPTIFDLLQNAGITWKVYVTDLDHGQFPMQDSALNMFATAGKFPQNIVPASQFLTDAANGTLPSVAYIDAGLNSGLDEHPGVDDGAPGGSIQVGAQYVSTLINALMQSPSWKDSAFILTYDEFGGFYDHVPPQKAVSPDGIPPQDLLPGPPPNGPDICVQSTGPTCDFVYTGYRVPLIVISPFAKKNYVSHTVADYTAWLKLVETRFNLPSLTKRDAAQMDMTEFFDFTNVPWKTPPTPPVQPTNGPCYQDHLP
jgi:phospholipase C